VTLSQRGALGGLAEFERELIRARTDDGRKRAKARGVKFGRPPARSYGVSQATISRLAAPSPCGASVAGV
jgi:DNA invertase Pin-like site-specific DNA recombinase